MVEGALANGLFVSFEGIDGAGKSTQIRLLAERLRAQGREVVETCEPGTTAIGVQIRRILLDRANHELSPTAEMLLYFAARAQNVDQIIRPALARGAIVISDRFTDSTLAYQGEARGLGAPMVMDLHRIACRGVEPSLTLYLDIDLATSAARRGEPDRLESEPDSFRQAVRDAYLRLVNDQPGRVHGIDGSQPLEVVAASIWTLVEPHVR
jgi:dTMP kinase